MLYLTLDDMPGETAEAKAAQYRQLELREAYYDAANAADTNEAPAVKEARTAYNQSVEVLEKMLGKDAHCNHVDCDLWEAFSDMFKEEVGCRPRGMLYTRQQALDWCLKNGTRG